MQQLTVTMICLCTIGAGIGAAQGNRIFAQRLVDEIKAAHPEITGLELAANKPGKGCLTIAATEAKEIGEKCDKDEMTARSTNAPFVEQEKTEFDATIPIHDPAGKVIATAGMDFKSGNGRTRETVTKEALKIGAEIEKRVTSEAALFQPVK